MQMTRALMLTCALASAARADDAIEKRGDTRDDLDLRLTLSSFLVRETGDATAPLVDNGASVDNASPVRRYFGDLRMELDDGNLDVDARVRQTSSERYQAGASSGGEYEVRTLSYKLGGDNTSVTVGRQYVDAVGASKIDGAALSQRLAKTVTGTLFAGAFPDLGSRSVDTDYAGGTIPLSGGLGVSYATPNYHGDVGAAAVYAPHSELAVDASRVFTTASGYWRPANPVDIYHFALVDVAGGAGARLTNGSLGVDVHPLNTLKVGVSGNHVSTDILQINARNTLADPDPTAMGIVQNDIAITRVSSDMLRATTSLALAQGRFEVSVIGGYHRRPAVDVPLADGTGAVTFPEAKSASGTLQLLDRKSVGGLRIALAGTVTTPLSDTGARSRGTVVRAAVSKAFADARGELEADVMGERFHDVGGSTCMTSLDPLACYGTAKINAAQAGVLASWQIAREWLLLADTHLGYQDIRSSSPTGLVDWPTVYSLTVFTRVQWRYR